MKFHGPIVMLLFCIMMLLFWIMFFFLGTWFGMMIAKPHAEAPGKCILGIMSQTEKDSVFNIAAYVALEQDSLITAYRYEVHAKYPDVNYPPEVWRMIETYYAKATVVGIAIGMNLKPVRRKWCQGKKSAAERAGGPGSGKAFTRVGAPGPRSIFPPL